MAVYTNDDIAKRNPPAGKVPNLPVVEQKEIDKIKKTYSEALMKDVYDRTTKGTWSFTEIAQEKKISIGEAKDIAESYKKVKHIGYSAEPIIFVPSWYDVIHLVDEKQLPEREQLKRMIDRIIRMEKSPSPEVSRNMATLLTAIDDVQDFATALGATARLLERITKTPQLLSKGSFTAGELLNSLNTLNKMPYQTFDPDALLKIVKKKPVDLDKLHPVQLKIMQKELTKIHPDWGTLGKAEQQQFMREHYKITRERWAQSLKVKKAQAEKFYATGTPWGKIKTRVAERLSRTLPSHGEMLEIAQTTDMMAGVGLSFGPIIGFILDLVNGIAAGAPIKGPRWAIDPKEVEVLKNTGMALLTLPQTTLRSLTAAGTAMNKAVYMIAAGEDLGVQDFLKATWTSAQAYVEMRGKELAHALTSIWEEQEKRGWYIDSGKRTSPIVRAALAIEGIPDEGGFPGVNLPKEAGVRQVAEAYLPRIQSVIKHFEEKLSGTIEGDFLASCLNTIAYDTACFYCSPGGEIETSQAIELTIYTRAVDYGLEPPIWATDEEFKNWHQYIMEKMPDSKGNGPEYKLLHQARKKFWN